MSSFFARLGKALTIIKDDDNEIDEESDEEIVLFHNKDELIKLEIPDKKSLKNSSDVDILYKNTFTKVDFEELEKLKVDQVLHVLKPKIVKYFSYEDIDFNCDFIKIIYSYAEDIGFDNTVGFLFPLVQELTFKKNTPISIIFAFLENFDKFLNYIYRYDTDHTLIINKLLPLITKILIRYKDIPLLNKARNGLKIIIECLTLDEVYSNIVPFLIELSNNEKNIIGLKQAMKIFNENAKIFGEDIIKSFILPQYESFSESSDESVRYCCINNLINIFENSSYDIVENKLMPIYIQLSCDSNSKIKKVSCDLIPNICKVIDKKLISKELLPIYLKLISDSDDDIKTSALTVFGEFISYLNKEDIIAHNELLSFYKEHILKLLKENKITEIQNVYKCAFSFPSVLLIYYKQINENTWETLGEIYTKLAKNKDTKIKTTIAYSFGEVSSLLDKNIVEKEICPLIQNMYTENGSKIKNIIIRIIPDYLTKVSDEKIKTEFLSIFKKGFSNVKTNKNWRDKLLYIKGIKKLSKLYDNSTNFKILLNMCCQFCFDNFETIRIKSAKIFSFIVLRFLITDDEENKKNKKKCAEMVKMFATCLNYKYRQLFIYICNYLIEDEKIFIEFVFKDFQNISYDKVSNVRVTLSKFLSKKWNKDKEEIKWIKNNNEMLEIIYRLKNDKDDDVKDYLKNVDIGNIDTINNENNEISDVNKKFTCTCEEMKNIFNFVPKL